MEAYIETEGFGTQCRSGADAAKPDYGKLALPQARQLAEGGQIVAALARCRVDLRNPPAQRKHQPDGVVSNFGE